MSIAKNLHNPIPLHESVDDWYENKKTFHGVCRYPIAKLGHMLPMCVTPINGTLISTADVSLFNSKDENVENIEVAVSSEGGRTPKAYFVNGFEFEKTHQEGIYYISITFGEEKFWSEPFKWVSSVDDLIEIEYERTSPIVTSTNYIAFAKPFKMYIDSEIMMPEYKYNTEVEEMDGVMFVRKKVSYKEHKFSFLCTDYFAEAIRMLWHCNNITIKQHGEEYLVDYMEAPQPSWNSDNHLMQMDVVFQTDTIMQTNGETLETE